MLSIDEIRGLLERLQAAKQTGHVSLSAAEVDWLTWSVDEWMKPSQVFACVCGKVEFGAEDYGHVEDGGDFTATCCGRTIMRVITTTNHLIAIPAGDEGEVINLKDVTENYVGG